MHCEVRASLILSLGPQVKRIATHIGRPLYSVQLEDLIQEGWLGAASAVDNFDSGRGVALKTYAEQKIRGAILDYLRRLDFMGRAGRRKTKKGNPDPKLLSVKLSLEGLKKQGRECGAQTQADPTACLELSRIIARAGLTQQELQFITAVYLRGEKQVDAAPAFNVHPSRMSQLRTSVLTKMRAVAC